MRIRYYCAISLIIGWAGTVHASPPQDTLRRLSEIKQPEPTFSIKLWTNKKLYQPGDPIEFSFRSDRDCYLTLLDVATEGVIRVIFPNKRHPENFIKADKTYNIPRDYNFQLKITGPSGIEQVKAIATTQKMDIFDMNFADGDYFFYETRPQSEVATRGLGGLADKLQKQQAWTEAGLEFEIRGAYYPDKGKVRSLEENTGLPAPRPVPSSGTQEHIKSNTRGLSETEDWSAPKPVPGTGTQEHTDHGPIETRGF